MDLDTQALTGLRVILNLWIMIFHAFFIIMYFVTENEIKALFGTIGLIEHGYLAVDGFFMLTGFLLILPFLQEQDKIKANVITDSTIPKSISNTSVNKRRASMTSSTIPSPSPVTVSAPSSLPISNTTELIHRYWKNRFLRVMIPYMALGIVHCLLVNRCGVYPKENIRLIPAKSMFDTFFPQNNMIPAGCDTVWANILHIPFLLPFNGTFMHSWSLGVQYYIWLLFPLIWYNYQLYKFNRLYYFTLFIIIFAVCFRGIAQYHSSTPGIEKGSIIGGVLDLFWYSSPFARAHIILLGTCIGKYLYDNYRSRSQGQTHDSTTKTGLLMDIGIMALCTLFFYTNTMWSTWTGEDSRYARGIHHTLFAMFLQVGTPFSGIVWMAIIYALVIRPGPISQWIGNGLSIKSLWNRLSDLSYFAFLYHPMVMTLLFSSTYLLYPPSSNDMRPYSDIPIILETIKQTLQSIWIIPESITTLLISIMNSIFILREYLLPSGTALSHESMLTILCVVSILVTYALSWISELLWEKPLYAYITKQSKLSTTFSYYINRTIVIYSWIVIISGIILIPIVTILGYIYITPEIEQIIKQQFMLHNNTNITTHEGI